uniref:Uncharacterized protein n=1 Tax=Macrostomum lignano TaxID=282301 RepID=A0A1I8HP32_9PLAT
MSAVEKTIQSRRHVSCPPPAETQHAWARRVQANQQLLQRESSNSSCGSRNSSGNVISRILRRGRSSEKVRSFSDNSGSTRQDGSATDRPHSTGPRQAWVDDEAKDSAAAMDTKPSVGQRLAES